MRTFVWLFMVAALFGFVIDVIYWFSSRVEPAGIALLSLMAIGMTFVAVYARFAERDARVAGDDPNAKAQDAAGEEIDIFTTETPWPFVVAVCACLLLCGVIWSPMLGLLALVALFSCFAALGRESSRT